MQNQPGIILYDRRSRYPISVLPPCSRESEFDQSSASKQIPQDTDLEQNGSETEGETTYCGGNVFVNCKRSPFDRLRSSGKSVSRTKSNMKSSIQGKVYNFLERPTGWKCFIYHFTVYLDRGGIGIVPYYCPKRKNKMPKNDLTDHIPMAT